MNRLTLKQRIIGALGFIVAILLIILLFIVYPVAKKINQLQKDINKIEVELEKRYENSQKLQRTVREISQITKETNLLSQIMIKNGEELNLITELEALAEKYHIVQNLNVSIKEIAPEERRAGLTKYYLLTFANEGRFSEHVKYLAELEKNSLYLITDNVRWEKAKTNKTGDQTVLLNFSSIIYVDPESINK